MLELKTKKYTCGVIIGRFQVPVLHSAHIELIETVLNRHQKVVIILGVSKSVGTIENPLPFSSRKQMFLTSFNNHSMKDCIDIDWVEDCKSDDDWSKEVDKKIRMLIGPMKTAVLYGGRDSFIGHYKGVFDTLELLANHVVSGVEIREKVSNHIMSDECWRKGAIWQAYNNYPKLYPTVDVAIFNGDKLLMIKKPNEKLWRFPGGFAEIKSKSFEEDAMREVREEVDVEIGDLKYIGSSNIDDWRYKGRDKIRTLLFVADYIFGIAKAGDDAAQCAWIEFSSLRDENIEVEHRELFKMVKEYKEKH